jgi:hypothetical protein
MATALVGVSHHNISPLLGKQLVLELKGGVGFTERRNGLPGSFGDRHARPFHQHMPHPTTKLGAQHAFWTLKRTAVTKRRQRRLGCRRCATKWLQHPDMKHIMYPSVVRELQAVSDLANALDHLERARILWTQLATTSRDKGLRVTVKQTQQHPIADCKLQSAMVSVVEAASILLRLKEPAAHFL